MVSPNKNPEGTILKSDKQLLREAGQRILQLEAEAKKGAEAIETLGVWNSRLRISLMAVGIHYRISPAEMEKIVTPYLDKQLEELKRQMDEVKEEFKAKLARGEKVDFIINDNPDKPADAGPDAPPAEPKAE